MMRRVFADSGYRTAVFGKWHLGDSFPFRPHDRGFHSALVHGGGGVGQIPDFWGNDYFDDTYFRNGRPEAVDGYCTDVIFREAMEFIDANRARPFFVYLSTNVPHSPYRVPDSYSERYSQKVEGDADLSKFYGMIANLDENVGQLLEQLRRLKLTENTIVVFMTDNGTARGAVFTDYRGNEGELVSGYNAGMRGRKGSPYEGGHRVPCFIRWPAGGLGGGRDIQRLTSHFDLFPTLIDLCQLKPPAEMQFDGVSLADLLRGHDTTWPERTLFVHHQELPRPKKYRYACAMRGNWRLLARTDKSDIPRVELFDLENDPGQTRDISGQHPDVVKELRAEYDKWWRGLSPSFDNDSAAIIGGDQNPTRLTCFEWHGSQRWQQANVRKGFEGNGVWSIEVAKPGKYEITLRRWPEELGLPITAPVELGKAILVTHAKVRIGTVEASTEIPKDAAKVQFTLELPQGKTRMQTWLSDERGNSRGAYYAYIRFVPD